VQKPADIIRSATVIGAEVVRMAGKIGVVKQGAFADLLVIDGDPLSNLGLFQNNGEHISAVMRDGEFVRSRL
jgi:imidazolonepropionase-like amidohydrolase